MNKKLYQAPQIVVVDIQCEGLIACAVVFKLKKAMPMMALWNSVKNQKAFGMNRS